MNGSNHLAESDRRPLHLCRCACVAAMEHRFDVLEYYGALERIDRDAGLRTKLTGLAAALKPCAENDHVIHHRAAALLV